MVLKHFSQKWRQISKKLSKKILLNLPPKKLFLAREPRSFAAQLDFCVWSYRFDRVSPKLTWGPEENKKKHQKNAPKCDFCQILGIFLSLYWAGKVFYLLSSGCFGYFLVFVYHVGKKLYHITNAQKVPRHFYLLILHFCWFFCLPRSHGLRAIAVSQSEFKIAWRHWPLKVTNLSFTVGMVAMQQKQTQMKKIRWFINGK